jgi:3-phosphoshikimate 1-carboxyvinyltransferase
MGVNIIEKEDEIILNPSTSLKNADLNSYNDHRLFMAFTIASMLTAKSIVRGAESIDVSYPSFLEDIKSLGAKVKVMH